MQSLNVVYDFLLRYNYQQFPGFFSVLGDPKNENVLDILTRDDIKIGIIGMGDLVGELKRCLIYLGQQGCDSIICAFRKE